MNNQDQVIIASMTNNKNYTLSTRAAAALLASLTSEGTEDQWVVRLRNWRKSDRLPPFTWDTTLAQPKYDPDELTKYAATHTPRSRGTQPTDDLPTAHATRVTLDDGSPAVALEWRDTSSAGRLVLSLTAAGLLSDRLALAIESAKTELEHQFNQAMEMDMAALRVRSTASGEGGELPPLKEAQARRKP